MTRKIRSKYIAVVLALAAPALIFVEPSYAPLIILWIAVVAAILAFKERSNLSVLLKESLAQQERLIEVNSRLEEAQFQLQEKGDDSDALITELTESNSELERFAYVASHDLQEPLRMIQTFAKLLQERLDDIDDPDVQKYLNVCVSSAERMQLLIQDLLAYARLGEDVEKTEEVKLENILTYVMDNLEHRIEETQAKITFGYLPACETNPVRLSRVLQNLIANALLYRKENDVPHIHVEALEQDGNWLFSVRDNGIGIASEYYGRIFEPFRRLHNRQKYSGTGLGLPICKKIIEQLGGKIWLDSKPGIGTCFYFTIPKEKHAVSVLSGEAA